MGDLLISAGPVGELPDRASQGHVTRLARTSRRHARPVPWPCRTRMSGPAPHDRRAYTAAGPAAVPTAVVMISALGGIQHAAPALKHGFPAAIIFGCDLGPNLTTVGSLATVLWLLILRQRDVDVSGARLL